MIPIASIFNLSFFVHGLVMLEVLLEAGKDQGCVVKVRDTSIFWIPAHIDDLAATL